MKAIFLYITFMALCGFVAAQAPMNQPSGAGLQKTTTIRYDLYVGDTTVNYSGKTKHALAINGSIPGPTLYFTEGDTAEIYVHNTLNEETSIHWHGIILPNQYDGVSYLTTQPIKAGQTHLFKFPIVQNGTYWYHSHTMFQEQSGMYGALVFYKRNEKPAKEYTMVLSDWTDMHPHTVNRYLHNASDWFAIKKGAVQSYSEAISKGYFNTKITNEWKRMNAMDVSDVYYERFLTNGKPVDEQPQFKAGDKVRLRVINGSSSTYFWLNYAGSKITVMANDGAAVVPVEVDRLLVGVSETYDVMVTVPADMSYEFLATAEDRTRSTSLWLGSGMKMPVTPLPRLKYFEGMKMMNGMMKMNGDLDTSGGMEMTNQQMDMNTVMYPEMTGDADTSKKHDMPGMQMGNTSSDIVTLNYGMLRAPEKTTLPDAPVKLLKFELTGNMNRYVWSINNKTVSETDKILIKKGENVRIILYNNTMMRHPMHLHGHFFRVLNGQGAYSPLKTVLDIMPMETDTIEFAATESGDWFFHCHILYHMMSGMGRVFSYENSPPNPEVPDPAMAYKMLKRDDRMLHTMARVGLESTGSDGEIMVANTRYRLSTEWRIGLNDHHGYESESHFGRYIGKMQWLFPYIGWDFRYRKMEETEKNLFGQKNTKDFRQVFHVGLQYTLPMLIVADASLDTEGKLRFQLMREDVPVTKRLRFSFMVNTDKEYMAGFRYIVTKNFALSTHYDSDMGLGAGITLSY
ncbi:CopA family copper-resistance protein [Chitinophaga niastensis]|uniref:CopA family copper-resistance protein n=1 Tax=Chitinophaga niastensis TaxID=536980 RepID=A0A2P8HGL1_CHINA|nr:multicopper oxidase domain-containing protein [Chitinophaga niastensis]PSL45351.1 CopA family copper-resistance protein [Chitinophaga niastensis]